MDKISVRIEDGEIRFMNDTEKYNERDFPNLDCILGQTHFGKWLLELPTGTEVNITIARLLNNESGIRYDYDSTDDIPLGMIDQTRAIAQALPHGSGLNGDWHITVNRIWLVCTNTYSAMDKMGGYCHDYPVEVKMRRDSKNGCWESPVEIKVKGRELKCCGIGLKGYLDEIIYDAVSPLLGVLLWR